MIENNVDQEKETGVLPEPLEHLLQVVDVLILFSEPETTGDSASNDP